MKVKEKSETFLPFLYTVSDELCSNKAVLQQFRVDALDTEGEDIFYFLTKAEPHKIFFICV